MGNNIIAILKTLSYADVFNYPLTLSELWSYLIINKRIERQDFILASSSLKGKISTKDGFFFLNGRDSIVKTRIEREKISNTKLIKAKIAAKLLSKIPTIELIGLSGSLSMRNAKKNDDIDFFIITKAHALWITRFFVSLLLLVTNNRRSKQDVKVNNKICVNMLISSHNLILPRKNLFTAHEVAQLKILINKNNAYEKFILENKWILDFLPNSFSEEQKIYNKNRKVLSYSMFSVLLKCIEFIFYKLQLFYMKRSRTSELVGFHIACFHPLDKTPIVLERHKTIYNSYLENLENIDNKIAFRPRSLIRLNCMTAAQRAVTINNYK